MTSYMAARGPQPPSAAPGKDSLYGGSGRDTYIFNLGDGAARDYLSDPEGAGEKNVIVFGPGVTPFSIKNHLSSLLIQYGDQGDSVEIRSEEHTSELQSRL